ncbi:MAG TPA: serine/threonine-protein kinase [Terriglobia bacterium]|nr:serine/threonine-protein kinase [Terriglobia bacterium]
MAPSIVKNEIDTSAIVSPQDWQRAKPVLTVAADLEQKDRTQLIEMHFPYEPALRGELLSMLEAHDRIKRALGPEGVAEFSLSGTRPSAAASTTSSEQLVHIGETYGPYRVVQMVGEGGMGCVYLAEDMRLGRHVALKSLSGRWLGSPEARKRLLREARTAAALTHPNIATLYDVLEAPEYLLLVMEYVEGRTAAAAAAEGRMPLGQAVRLTIQICQALIYAHDRGIIHCDLKPSNVQVSPDGTAKVLDFGLAHAKYDRYEADSNSPPSRGPLVGTPPYMPPERLLTGVLTVGGDVYSLGATLFEMVTGRRPFEEADFATLTSAIIGTAAPTVSSIVPESPACLDKVVARALEKYPNRRYQSARELCTDLQEVLRELDPETVEVPTPAIGRSVRLSSRSLLAAIVVLVTFVGLSMAGFLASTFYGSPLRLTGLDGESPIWWPIWGLRSLVLPLAQIGLALLALGVGTQLWRAAFAFTSLQRWYQRMVARAHKPVARLRSIRVATLASTLLAAQIVAWGLFWWRFRELVFSYHNFFLHSGTIAALAHENSGEHRLYVRVLSLLLLAFGLSWYRLLKLKRQTRQPTGAATLWAGIVMMMLMFCCMVMPYRLFFQSSGERVSYQSQLCYLVGQKGTEAQLFCPQQAPPWTRLVSLTDPALKRSGTTERIFSATSGN